jgi:hypothetical protein
VKVELEGVEPSLFTDAEEAAVELRPALFTSPSILPYRVITVSTIRGATAPTIHSLREYASGVAPRIRGAVGAPRWQSDAPSCGLQSRGANKQSRD